LLSNGDIITLHHVLSSKRLTLTKKGVRWTSAPMSKWELIVAGKDNFNVTEGDQWKVQFSGEFLF